MSYSNRISSIASKWHTYQDIMKSELIETLQHTIAEGEEANLVASESDLMPQVRYTGKLCDVLHVRHTELDATDGTYQYTIDLDDLSAGDLLSILDAVNELEVIDIIG